MSSRRVLKVAQAIREVVSLAILMDIKDPRVSDVTVTYVEVSGDLRIAKVHVSVMGDETKQRLCLKGLTSSRGFLQKKVGNRVDTKYTPQIQFVLDKGVKNSMVVTKILDEVLPHDSPDGDDEQVTDSPATSPSGSVDSFECPPEQAENESGEVDKEKSQPPPQP